MEVTQYSSLDADEDFSLSGFKLSSYVNQDI